MRHGGQSPNQASTPFSAVRLSSSGAREARSDIRAFTLLGARALARLPGFEREVAATRAGISDRDGAVAQVDVAGVAAVAYDHFDSRAGDPQLHTHVVIANKVRTVRDGKWRTLDGTPLHHWTVAVSQILHAFNEGMADRPDATFGTMNDDVLAHFDQSFTRQNFVEIIENNAWPE